MTLQWATFIMASIAGVGSLVRIYQNHRAYQLARENHKLMKKRAKKGKKA